MSPRDELAPERQVVVDLSVEDDGHRAVLVEHGLIRGGRQVHDREPPEAEADAPVRRDPEALAVRAPVRRSRPACGRGVPGSTEATPREKATPRFRTSDPSVACGPREHARHPTCLGHNSLTLSHIPFRTLRGPLFAGVGIGVAGLAVLPYHSWDAFAFGEWSRLIAQQPGSFFFPTVSALSYQRPFFYVLQGGLWAAFGFHEFTGRGLSLAFAALLAWSVSRIVRSLDPDSPGVAYAWLLPFAIPDFLAACAAGTTDVPAAALVAATAARMLAPGWPRSRGPMLVLLSFSAALMKPTAVPALLGLACAAFLFWPLDPSMNRLGRRVAPLGFGLLLAGVYFTWLAARLGTSVRRVLVGELEGYYTTLAAEARWPALLHLSWLGPTTGALLFASTLWLLLATTRRRTGASATFCLGAAAALVGLPVVARWARSGGTPPGSALVTLAVLVLVMAAARNSAPAPPTKRRTFFLVTWAFPSFAVWIGALAYDSRLLAPAWAPLLLLIWSAVSAHARGSFGPGRRIPALLAALAVIGMSVRQLDGLDARSVACLSRSITAGRFQTAAMRECLVPDLEWEVDAVSLVTRASGRESVISNDGRLRFFFPGRVNQSYAQSCESLSGYGAFVLVTDPSSRSYMASKGISADPADWASCRDPHLALAAQRGDVSVFSVGP